ncbi:hypothetical protein AAVH_08167 [Aphelenchoides avenae]|nr:hypothetical protein AAVH_08167 [Aphelenchus avenae]
MFRDRHMCGYPIVIVDPYEAVNPARSVDDTTFPKIVEAFRATRDALFSFIRPFQDLRLNAAALDEKDSATNGALSNDDAEEGRKSAQNGGTSTEP